MTTEVYKAFDGHKLKEGQRVRGSGANNIHSKQSKGIKTECNIWALTSVQWWGIYEEGGEVV